MREVCRLEKQNALIELDGGGGGDDDSDDGESNFDGGIGRDYEANALTTRLRRRLMRNHSKFGTLI